MTSRKEMARGLTPARDLLPVTSARPSLIHPTAVREPFHRDGWLYEEKYDGWRMVALKDGSTVRLVSRNGVDHTSRFSALAQAIRRLAGRSLVLDGEVCSFDSDLMSRMKLA